MLNRADSAYGIRIADVENSIGRKVDHTVVSDGRTVVYALNRGVPFVWSNKQAQVSQDILAIARAVAGDAAVVATPDRTHRATRSCSRGADMTCPPPQPLIEGDDPMSLLRRIESARPGADGRASLVPPAARPWPPQGRRWARRLPVPQGRMLSQVPPRESFRDTKFRIQQRVISDLDPKLDLSNQVEVRRQIEEIFGRAVEEEGLALTRAERVRMLEQITDEIVGLGPLEPLLRDESITEVMVNGPRQVYIERSGKLELTNVTFQNDDHVMRIIDRIIAPIGRRVDESSPMVDARLVDGSRVNAIIPPISPWSGRSSPSGSSRRRRSRSTTSSGSAPPRPRCSTSSRRASRRASTSSCPAAPAPGKTTMLNILSSFIPNDERIVTIEDAAELQLRQEHVVTLESRPPNIEGKGAIPIRELVRNALRMRPDRIIVGECRGRGAGHAPGHEHRPRRLDVDGPRQHAARHARPPRDDGADGRRGPAAARHPRADRLGGRPHRPPEPSQGRHPQDHQHHRGPGHGG